MARLSKRDWELLRIDYEVHNMTLRQLEEKYGANNGNISKRAKKYRWQREKVQQIINEKVSAVKALDDAKRKSTALGETTARAIDKEAERLIRLEGIFGSAVEYNQVLANKVLQKLSQGAKLQEINLHSQITSRNKESVVGKPQTQVNIQQNNATTTASMTEAQIREELKSRGLPQNILDE